MESKNIQTKWNVGLLLSAVFGVGVYALAWAVISWWLWGPKGSL